MPVNTYIEQARRRVETEREAVEAKIDAYQAFHRRIEGLATEQTASTAARVTATTGPRPGATDSGIQCRTVRSAFDETVRPHSVADLDSEESLLATIGNELTETIAVALSPTTATSFTADLERAICSTVSTRVTENEVLARALRREASHLDAAAGPVTDITAWIADVNETPLTELGFDALQARHETLADHRDRCDDIARRRQAFLRERTSQTVDFDISHRRLVTYLYEDAPVEFPVLATVARLDAVCRDCQRTVRNHLVRRA